MPQIFNPDGVLVGGEPSPQAPTSAQVAQLAQLDKRNKILLQHSQKTEAAAKMFADKLDQIAKARQAFANENEDAAALPKFLVAIDAALEKKFLPEIPFGT